MPVKIELTRGFEATVDDVDYHQVSKYKWRVSIGKWGNYAVTWMRIDGRGRHVYLHRFLLDFPKGKLIAFVNKNSLDCRRENLKFTTRSESQLNRVLGINNRTVYKGVSKVVKTGKYKAYLKRNGILIHLGVFETADAAAEVYNEKAAQAARSTASKT